MNVLAAANYLLSQRRVSNEQTKLIPFYYPSGIYLPDYFCMMLGKRKGVSYVEIFYIQRQVYLGFTHYLIAWYPLCDVSVPPIRFWVYTGATLKKRIFGFDDHIPFKKCVYILLPEIGLTRLCMIPQYIIPFPVTSETSSNVYYIVKDYEVVTMKTKEDFAPTVDTVSEEKTILNSQSLFLLHQVSKELTSQMLSEEQKSVLRHELLKLKMK